MAKTKVHWLALVVCAIDIVHRSQGQFAGFNDPTQDQASRNLYFLTSKSDCNGPTRDIYNVQAHIKGHDGSGGVDRGPTDCTISLKTGELYPGNLLLIEVIAMDIRDPGTMVTIYDGDAAQIPLGSFDMYSTKNPNRRTMRTSGSAATFVMRRENVEQFNFNIHIRIKPISGGTGDNYENNYGTWNTFDKYSQEIIVGLIGGFYLAMILIVVVVIILYYRSVKGKDQKWETMQLSVMKTNSRLDMRSQPSNAWSTDLGPSRPPASHYSTDPYPRKYPGGDGDSDDTFQRKRLMNGERDRMDPPRYATNNTFEDPDEDDPDHFEEKVITSRVRTKRRGRGRPPSYDEAMSEQGSESERSSEDEKSDDSSDESIHKRSISSEERSSRRDRSSQSETESESESESEEEDSEDDSRRGRGARGGRSHRKPPKRKGRRRRPESSDGDGPSRIRQPQGAMVPPPMAAPPPPGYPAYPPGQFVPMMAAGPMMPAYAPPQYPPEDRPPQPPQVQPTDPPVYSYLVRRGYTPMDARSQGSMAGSQRSDPAPQEEPDIRLSSGVEYMKR